MFSILGGALRLFLVSWDVRFSVVLFLHVVVVAVMHVVVCCCVYVFIWFFV